MHHATVTHTPSRETYLRLLGYVRPYWKTFALALLCMALTASTEPIFPALMKPLLDGSFGKSSATAQPYLFPFLIVALFLGRGLVGFMADYAMSWVANKVVTDLRNAMFARMVTLPTEYFANQSSGALMSKVAYDVTGVTGAATNVVTVLVRDSLGVLGLLGWLFYLNWKLTLIALVLIPVMGVAVKAFSQRLRDMSRYSQRAMGKITHVLDETIGAHKVVKVFGGQDYEKRRFDAANREQRGYNMRYQVAAGLVTPITQIFAAVALAIIVGVALHQSTHDQTTVGGFVSFITAMLMLLAPMKRLTDVNAPLQRGLAAADSVFELVDEVPEDDRGSVDLGRARGALAFEQVTFHYGKSERRALDGVSFTAEPGETIALVGASGSGKTTVANLIPRFYRPESGRIVVDGHDVNTVRLQSLRANIALVSQEVVLFNDSVAANIAYGAMGGTPREEIVAAARAAHALEFIEAMPDGFDTLIGENGVKLSGGQRQRLAIARAILKNAPILVLDEATSALDTESERHVQAALETLMQGRTTIVIAHRLSTIENADRILVMHHGRIVETGCHEDLMALGGIYHRLQHLQAVSGVDTPATLPDTE